MTPNDAPPLSEEEIAELRACLLPYTEHSENTRALFDRLVAERDALREENAKVRDSRRVVESDREWMIQQNATTETGNRLLRAKNASLKAEVERLKADGERWLEMIQPIRFALEMSLRGLRPSADGVPPNTIVSWRTSSDGVAELLAAIDLARKAQGGE